MKIISKSLFVYWKRLDLATVAAFNTQNVAIIGRLILADSLIKVDIRRFI